MKFTARIAIKLGNIYFNTFVKTKHTYIKKAVFFGLPGLGDCLMITPAIHRFHEIYPDCKIYVYAYPHTFPLFKNNPYITKLIPRYWSLSSLLLLKKENIDLAIMLEMFKTPIWAYLAGIPMRRGNCKDKNGFALTDKFNLNKQLKKKTCITWANLISKVDNKYTIPEIYNVKKITGVQDKILLFPDAGTTEIANKKAWPFRYWVELIKRIGIDNVILLGSDISINKAFKKEFKKITSFIGWFSLNKTLRYIRSCKTIITNDSFALHASAAFNKPTIVIFGPTDNDFLCPYPNAISITSNLPCSPCFYKDDIIKKCQTQECLKRITPDVVYHYLNSLISGEKNLYS